MIITPTHVRLAVQMAAARGLKCPSLEFEEFVAQFITSSFKEPNPLPGTIHVHEFITIEEAHKRGLAVPERAGSTIQLFAYKPAGEIL